MIEFQWRDAVEQPCAGAERERRDVWPQLVDHAGGEALIPLASHWAEQVAAHALGEGSQRPA